MKQLIFVAMIALAAPLCGGEATRGDLASFESSLAGTSTPDSIFPVGWHAVGVCTGRPETFRANRDSVLAHLRTFRTHGVNSLLEPASADGRIIPRAETPGWYNWYGYSFVDADGAARRHGHPRPGVFVEGMKWLLDQAYGDGETRKAPIRVIVALDRFIAPGYEGDPYGGGEHLSCAEYRGFIADEKRRVARSDRERAARIPGVQCTRDDADRPFWEWNMRYVVENLADHPGLLAWYLWDEPEGITYRHLFGIVEDRAPRAYTGPSSLPTPDFLRYTYRLVRDFDHSAGGENPVIIDMHSPHVFFSDRFTWSVKKRAPEWDSGPFDVAPDGSYNTPADVLGLEASGKFSHTRGAGPVDRLAWYWDPNFLSRTADMLHEVTLRDDVQTAIVAAGQAQLPSDGPYAPKEELRCDVNDADRTRLLSSRDLVWQFLTPLIDGLKGYIFYSHALMPATGPGGEQVARTNRLIAQFRQANLDQVLLSSGRDDLLTIESVHIESLTDYFRADFPPHRIEKTKRAAPSALSRSMTVEPEGYTVRQFGRSGEPRTYGQAAAFQRPDIHLDHRLLRSAVREHEGYVYLFLSNAYDARITTRIGGEASHVVAAQFELEEGGSFQWMPFHGRIERTSAGNSVLEIPLEPYEAVVLRVSAN